MLTDLTIRNFAIAEDLTLEFCSGLTVLTGETGAGKSILVDALGLVLGDRADPASVRSGASQADIAAGFDVAGLTGVSGWLADHDLDADGECHLRRVVSSAGRSKAYVNGRSVALQALRELGGLLMDIHGQHEHQTLVKPRAQRDLIDAYGGHERAVRAVHDAFDHWYRLDQQYRALRAAHAERNEKLDLLRFQVEELGALALIPGEYEKLAEEQRRVANLAALAEGVTGANDLLAEREQSTQDTLGNACRLLTPLVELDPTLSEALTMLEEAQIQVDEAGGFLRRYQDGLGMDAAERDALESRLDAITDVARKHRVAAAALSDKYAELTARLDDLENADTRLDELASELDDAAQDYRTRAATLSKKRATAARKLKKAVEKIIRELGMPQARFDAVIDARDAAAGFGRDGLDRITLHIAANPGEPARPLAKVASGGELSRISLAIQVVTARVGATRCMVFDEVDAGIGGAVAQIVGQQLRDLAGRAQVLCVTHLAQVASQAHQHLKVSKSAAGGKTRSAVAALDGNQKIEELARMLGGVKITARTREHAAEMLAQAGGR